ncbi:Iron-sulfur cluster assembly enzyme ISCU, mitochondrial [Halotydeus destructor]|nr:Iron-sulfur cluster assembly enzyme ISCU, mitochondrial [Halotydeus destructor]
MAEKNSKVKRDIGSDTKFYRSLGKMYQNISRSIRQGSLVGRLQKAISEPAIVIPSAKYHEKVIDHYENPRNAGSFDKKEENIGTGLVGAPACGDVMKLQIKVDDNGKIVDAKFKTFGCGSAIASSSFATEWIKGKTLDEAGQIKNSVIANELRLPPVKLHCSMLAEDAIKAALKDYKTKFDKSAGKVASPAAH